jgi:hypothetical protein
MDEIDDLRIHGRVATHGETRLLIGPTGVGKSALLHRYASNFPSKQTATGRHTPVLIVDAPDKCTMKELAQQILRGLNDPAPTQGTQSGMVDRIVLHFQRQQVELLIIDESQQVTTIDGFVVGNFIKNLLNRTKQPILIAGLPSVSNLEEMNQQFGDRRKSDIRMSALDWKNDLAHRQVYGHMLKAFQEMMMFPLSNFNLYDQAFAERIAFASRGLIRRTVNYIREAEALGRQRNSKALTLVEFSDGWSKLHPDGDPQKNPFRTSVPNTWAPASDDEGDRKPVRGNVSGKKKKAGS